MPQRSLHPLLSGLIYVLAVFAVLQWVIIMPLVFQAGLLTSLDCWIGDRVHDLCPSNATVLTPTAAGMKRIAPFTGDFFFIGWNVAPILLAIAHWFISTYYKDNHEAIRRRFRTESNESAEITKPPIRDNLLLVFGLLAILITIAIYAQLNKQADFTTNREFLYWWDRDVSPLIFYVRLFFVVPVIVLFALVLWEAYWGLWTLFRLARTRAIVPQVLDPLRRFGMQSTGVLLLLMITPWFIGLMVSIIGWYDHQNQQGASNSIGNILVGGIAVFGLWLIADPLLRIHSCLERQRQTLLRGLEVEAQELEAYLGRLSTGSAPGGGMSALATPAYLVHQHVLGSSGWPLPRIVGPPTLFSLVSPFFGAFGISASALLQIAFERLGIVP